MRIILCINNIVLFSKENQKTVEYEDDIKQYRSEFDVVTKQIALLVSY